MDSNYAQTHTHTHTKNVEYITIYKLCVLKCASLIINCFKLNKTHIFLNFSNSHFYNTETESNSIATQFSCCQKVFHNLCVMHVFSFAFLFFFFSFLYEYIPFYHKLLIKHIEKDFFTMWIGVCVRRGENLMKYRYQKLDFKILKILMLM